jgi:hypothetical protein
MPIYLAAVLAIFLLGHETFEIFIYTILKPMLLAKGSQGDFAFSLP